MLVILGGDDASDLDRCLMHSGRCRPRGDPAYVEGSAQQKTVAYGRTRHPGAAEAWARLRAAIGLAGPEPYRGRDRSPPDGSCDIGGTYPTANSGPMRERQIAFFGIRGLGSAYYLAYDLNHGSSKTPTHSGAS